MQLTRLSQFAVIRCRNYKTRFSTSFQVILNNNLKKKCWKCDNLLHPEDLICTAENCQSIQRLNPNEISFFKIFDLKPQYNIDEGTLDKKYKVMQTYLHPDKFVLKPSNEKEISAETSSIINIAYKTLKTPISRINYLVTNLYGVKDFDSIEINQLASKNQGLIMEIFELREEISDCDDIRILAMIQARVFNDFNLSAQHLDKIITSNQSKEEAIEVAVKANYFWKVYTEVEEKIFRLKD